MKKIKVEIIKTYCIDVFANDEKEAKIIAEEALNELMLGNVENFYETGDTEFNTYDVTNTDDPFNPLN